jgi:predicted TIM-barrel fold metal-dependent hydrolase
MIIDAHVHVRVDGTGSRGLTRVLGLADRAGFDKIFGISNIGLKYDLPEGNRQLGEALRRYPDRLLGYVSIPSARLGQAAVDEIQRGYEVYGMHGVKLVHRVSGLGSYALITSLGEPPMIPIVEKAAELGMVLLLHASPEECEWLAERVPEASIIMAHSGGCPTAWGDWPKAIETAKRCPGIYLDTASSMVDYGYIEAAVKALGAERLTFGTDMPLLDPWTQLAKVTGAELEPEEKALILSGNIARLVGLEA